MGKGKSKGLIPDPNIKFISLETGKREHKIHNKILAVCVNALYQAGYHNINYDHIKLSIPKCNVPLSYGKRRVDIAFFLDRETLGIVEIEVIKIWQSLEEQE